MMTVSSSRIPIKVSGSFVTEEEPSASKKPIRAISDQLVNVGKINTQTANNDICTS